eukprot:GEMP01010228.1.p1 GENE.GEMP01010228.1~~GEMP01010228.1.p1  ORF type:complete len:569 (+),score=95.53 GEMP01010228.1:338-2044(+)
MSSQNLLCADRIRRSSRECQRSLDSADPDVPKHRRLSKSQSDTGPGADVERKSSKERRGSKERRRSSFDSQKRFENENNETIPRKKSDASQEQRVDDGYKKPKIRRTIRPGQAIPSFEEDAYVRMQFRRIDPAKDGTGSLNAKLAHDLLKNLDVDLRLQSVAQLIRHLDEDGEWTVNVDQFQVLYRRAKNRAILKKNAVTMLDSKTFLVDLFNEFCSSADGMMTTPDLYELCEFLQMSLSRDEVVMLQSQIDLDGNGTIEMDELLQFLDEVKSRDDMVVQLKRCAFMEMSDKFLETIFKKFDVLKKGSLGLDELVSVVQFLKLDFSPTSCKNLLFAIDTDGNGTVELSEFKTFFFAVRQWSDLRKSVAEFNASQHRAKMMVLGFFIFANVSAVFFFILSRGATAQSVKDAYMGLSVMSMALSGLLALPQLPIGMLRDALKCIMPYWFHFVLLAEVVMVFATVVLILSMVFDEDGRSDKLPNVITLGSVTGLLGIGILVKTGIVCNMLGTVGGSIDPNAVQTKYPVVDVQRKRSMERPPVPHQDRNLPGSVSNQEHCWHTDSNRVMADV